MVSYEEVVNNFIKLGLYELDGQVVCFKNLWIDMMGCESALAYERKIMDKEFISKNWNQILETYQWLIKEQEIELNPCVEMESYQLIMWMFRKGIKEKLQTSSFFNRNKENNIYINSYMINRLLDELGIEKEIEIEQTEEIER